MMYGFNVLWNSGDVDSKKPRKALPVGHEPCFYSVHRHAEAHVLRWVG